MSDSERKGEWPVEERRRQRERRAGERRRGADRRSKAVAEIQGERRSGQERRDTDRRTGRDRRNEAEWQPVPIELTASANFDAEMALIAAATDARTHARAAYSNFQVGAALETSDGQVIGGCNIENATYGLTLCAERVALVKALSDGHAVFTRMAIVADTGEPTPPCGPCRQLLWEYCGDIDIIVGNLNGPAGRYRLSSLLPMPFDARLLR